MAEENKTIKKNFLTPLRVVGIQKVYWFWLIIIPLISCFPFLIDLFSWKTQNMVEKFSQGFFYTVCIALLVPFLFGMLIDSVVSHNNRTGPRHYTYKVSAGLATLGLIIILFALNFSSISQTANIIIQIIFFIVALFFAFYMFCINSMEDHRELDQVDDHLITQKENMNETMEKAKKPEPIKNDKGEKIKL